MMEEYKQKMQTVRTVSTIGISFGAFLVIVGLVVSGFSASSFMALLGGGIILASMVFFGFGLFLGIIEEIADRSKGESNI
ncbi:hypothetical protein [Litchfieldia alkalitelluris]|uniref:hypothetical protein n=1 Tax=Litchfieldia alkalitelluris TaxID=304268 RepID=UPI000998D9A3|nr:hypothetical protein [Litchfieldia alkalitelluris]